jgi:DNA-binding PadR family transcriptional regulator
LRTVLARRTGISFQTISEIENGRKARASTVRKLAQALGEPETTVAALTGAELPNPRGNGRGERGAEGLAPMGLAILGMLREQPLHPYEMVSRMRERHVDMYIKVNFGAVYYHIEQLLRRELITVHDVERDGNRPERTVYAITPPGRALLQDELVAAMSSMTRHYDPLDAGLHLAHLLDPAAIESALEERKRHLGRLRAQLEHNTASAWAHLTVSQHHILRRHLAWMDAEDAWIDAYLADVRAGHARRLVSDSATV